MRTVVEAEAYAGHRRLTTKTRKKAVVARALPLVPVFLQLRAYGGCDSTCGYYVYLRSLSAIGNLGSG